MQRRPKGTGSVTFHKATGKWLARYKKRCAYCKTEAEAKRKLRIMIEEEGEIREMERHLAEIPAGGFVTIRDAVEQFIDYKAPSLKDTSLDRLEQTARCRVIPYIGNYNCLEFSDEMYYNKLIIPLIQEDLSFSSIKKVQDFMFPFCKWCSVQSRRYMLGNPLDGLEKLTEASVHGMKMRYGTVVPEELMDESERSHGIIVLDAEQRVKFVKACRAKYSTGTPRFPHGEAFVFVMYTGLRIGEMAALRWQDVDLTERKIKVRSNLVGITCRDPNSPQFGKRISRINPFTKTNRPRTIPLGDMAYDSIMRMYVDRNVRSPLVLCNRNGDMVDPVVIQSGLRRIYNLAGISLPSGVNAHALRHTFASMCFESGMSVKQVSELLGHKSTQLTIDTYIHLLNDVNLESMPELATLK